MASIETALQRDRYRFAAFFYDLLSYCMADFGAPWYVPDVETKEDYKNNKRFHEYVGDAVLLYHTRHVRELIEELLRAGHHLSMKDFLLVIAGMTFRGEDFIKEFFKFCAQIITLGVHLIDSGQDERVERIVTQMGGVYETYLQRRFNDVGGWISLQRYAIRYYMYGE